MWETKLFHFLRQNFFANFFIFHIVKRGRPPEKCGRQNFFANFFIFHIVKRGRPPEKCGRQNFFANFTPFTSKFYDEHSLSKIFAGVIVTFDNF